jgi:molybdate transport system substrate-binding protein
MKRGFWFLTVLLFALLLSSCAPKEGGKLTVMAAASLTEPFGQIGEMFKQQHPGATVEFTFAGSQQLVAQLGEGAPADVFASASKKTMDDAVTGGRVAAETSVVFVRNRLVVVYPGANPAGLTALADLARPGLKLILAAKEVPVGQYSLDFLDKASAEPAFGTDYKQSVLGNVVSYEENVKSVLTKVSLGEADAGIVYSSDAGAKSGAEVGVLDIPDALNVVASYPIAVVKDSASPKLAQAFVDLVLSPVGQQILADYGFVPVKEPIPRPLP